MAIIHPKLATSIHRLIMDKDFWEAQKYDLHVGSKLEYMLNFLEDYAIPEDELDRLVKLANEGIWIPWRLCNFDQEAGARRNEIKSPGIQAKKCLENSCPYFHTKSLQLIMDEHDVRMEDQPGAREEVSMSSSSSEDETTTVAAKLQAKSEPDQETPAGGTSAGGSNEGTTARIVGSEGGWQERVAMAIDAEEQEAAPQGTVIAESRQNGE